MDPHEILPTPEVKDDTQPDKAEGAELVSEKAATQKTEKKTVADSGFGAVAATAVDDAQTQVQGVVGGGIGATTTATVTQLDVPEIAEDIDLIEKEWVKKAKDIVAATQGDPHAQNNQINKMKVEYIKKRYNKDIKFREE